MEQVYNTSVFIFLITVILCTVAGLVVFIYSRNKSANNKWLAGYYLAIGYGILIAFLLYSGLIKNFPWYHTYRTGYIAGFLIMPFSYFYIRSLMLQKRFGANDLIHFLPAVIFAIDFIPFYFSSPSFKLRQLTIDASGFNTIWGQFSQGWIGIGFIYVPLRIALSLLYWVLQAWMIYRSRRIGGGNTLIAENREIMTWAKVFCGSQLLFFIPYYLNQFLGGPGNFFFVVHTILAISVASTILFLILRPNILYGLKGVLVKNSAIEASHQEDIIAQDAQGNNMNSFLADDEALAKDLSSTKTNEDVYLPAGKLASLGDQLKVDLLRQRIYLKKGCTTAMLAAEMGVQPYLLSAVINQVFKTNFNDFLNQYRVEHAKNLIGNGQAKMLTLEALSEECGFNNRNSFTMAFKKHTGKTPSEFIKGDFASAP